MIRNVLRTVGLVRASFAAAIGMFAFSVYGQEPPPGPAAAGTQAGAQGAAAEVERVIVTGSNIPTAEEVGPNPVFSLNRDLIGKSGQGTTVETLLKSQPVFGASSVPVMNNSTGQGGPTGTASISLRGFDPGASLLLIDGRRVAPFPGGANSGAAFVDLTSLPITAVQSIEILKDGASTTYGADAVAGVVNLKLYKDYRGAQVTLQYGDTLDKDAAEYSGDILFGVGDDKVSITGDLFYYRHHDMFAHDRGNTLTPPFLSGNTSPWNLRGLSPAVVAAAGGTVIPGVTTENASPPDFTNGLAPASDYVYSARRVRGFTDILPGFNFDLFQTSFPGQERWGGYVAFNDKICDDQLQIYGDFFHVDGKTHDELAPVATGPFETPGSPVLFIPPHAPLPVVGGVTVTPPGTPTASEVAMPPGAFNPFNPFEQIISGNTQARLADFGNRLIDNENIADRFTLGVKGDKLFNGSWGYDGAFMYSQIQQISRFQGVNGPRFEQILNGNDPIFNPTSASFIGQTTPYNPMIDFRSAPFASNLPLIGFATLHTRDLFTSKLATLDLNIYTTDLFDLPAGGVGLAVGGVFSRESYTINPDDQNRLAQNAGVGQELPVHAGRKEYSFYGETLIPIFSPTWNIPGFHALEFTAGVRYEAFRNNDTNATVPKVGVRWQPFDEQLTIRSTWGEGYLEPSLVELFGPTRFLLGPSAGTVIAPPGTTMAGTPQSAVNPEQTIEQLPNPALHSEHDRTWSGGIVYTPKWIPPGWGTATLTVDFWDVERTGVVAFLAPSTIIAGFNSGIFPGIISPAKPTLATGPAVLFDPAGDVTGVSAPYLNGARENARGVDLGFQYQIETNFGTWTSLTRVSYLDSFIYQFPGSIAREVAGRANNGPFEGSFFGDVTSGDAWVKWKGESTLDWTWHNWDLNATVHLFDGFWEQLFAPSLGDSIFKQHYVHPTWFTDAQLSYTMVFTPPVEQQPVAGYSKGGKEVITSKEGGKKQVESAAAYTMPCWQTLLNNTTFTVGVNDIFGEDPPKEFGFEFGNAFGIPGSTYDNLGRFVYGRLTKKF